MQKRAAAPKPAKQTITKKLQRAKSQEEPIENDSEEEESKRQQSDSDAGGEVRQDLLSTDMPITDFNISCLRKTFKQ
jgi:hypothetical protein